MDNSLLHKAICFTKYLETLT